MRVFFFFFFFFFLLNHDILPRGERVNINILSGPVLAQRNTISLALNWRTGDGVIFQSPPPPSWSAHDGWVYVCKRFFFVGYRTCGYWLDSTIAFFSLCMSASSMLGNFAHFFVVCWFVFQKQMFWKPLRVQESKSLDPDQARHFVGPDLAPNTLQRVSADYTRKQRVNKKLINFYHVSMFLSLNTFNGTVTFECPYHTFRAKI